MVNSLGSLPKVPSLRTVLRLGHLTFLDEERSKLSFPRRRRRRASLKFISITQQRVANALSVPFNHFWPDTFISSSFSFRNRHFLFFVQTPFIPKCPAEDKTTSTTEPTSPDQTQTTKSRPLPTRQPM